MNLIYSTTDETFNISLNRNFRHCVSSIFQLSTILFMKSLTQRMPEKCLNWFVEVWSLCKCSLQLLLRFAWQGYSQGLLKGAILCFRNPYFYFWHGESTSTASQLTSPASQKSKHLNKVSLLLQDLGLNPYFFGWLE